MRFLSVCSGIEAASVAWHPLGWEAAAVAEIDPFACHALSHHYGASRPMFMPDPDAATKFRDRRARGAAIKAVARLPDAGAIPNFGDLTQFKDWPDVAIDLLVGGTPCQSFSVAGLRKGLDDPRGNLTLVYLAILERYRPRWMVWENVPGVLSDKGNAFGAFLGGLGQLGYGFAYRVLDAQYIRVDGFARAVPQRRRRVFVVGCLGDWRRAAAVLFERESLSGHPAPRRQAGERPAPTLSSRTQGGGGLGTDFDCDGGHSDSHANAGVMPAIAFDARQSDVIQYGECTGPLDTDGQSMGILQSWHVRRLMPVECERLQGFPDGYTDIPYRGRNWTPDGPRYKALGNSMAVNAMRWIGTRISMVDQIEEVAA